MAELTSEQKVEELEKRVAVLETQVVKQLFVQVESQRVWMQNSYELMLEFAGQKLAKVPEQPPWVEERVKEEMGVYKKPAGV